MPDYVFFIIMMAVFMSASAALYYFYSKDDDFIMFYNREYDNRILQNQLEKIQSNTDALSKAIDRTSVTAKEATEAFKGLNRALDSPEVSTLYADNIPILTSDHGIIAVPKDVSIEKVGKPKEYCQCEYCGTFYNEFVSNCKNCGALIPVPNNFGKIDCIIKTNYIDRDKIYENISRSKHNLFDI